MVRRPTVDSKGRKPNILDACWIHKTKTDTLGNKINKSRLVIRGFKDSNMYDVEETYAPVKRLSLIRTLFASANKHKL